MLTDKLREALRYFEVMVNNIPDRAIRIFYPEQPPLLVYTDASTRPEGLRLGALICVPGQSSLCTVLDVPNSVLDLWRFRQTYINQAELLAGPLVAYMFPQVLARRLVFWFFDNTSACTAMLKASSPQEDNSRMALIASLALTAVDASVWYEYVHTKQNPADCLSRGGFCDPEVQQHLSTGEWKRVEPLFVPWERLVSFSFKEMWDLFAALGVHED